MKEVMSAFENWHTAWLSLCFAMAAFRSATAIAKLSRVELLGRKRRAEAPSWHTKFFAGQHAQLGSQQPTCETTAGFKKESIVLFHHKKRNDS